MAQISIKMDISNAVSVLDVIKGNVPQMVEAGIKGVAMYARDKMTTYAQAGHPEHPNVITGRLSGSMRFESHPAGYKTTAEVGSDVDYAPYVEFGHMSRSWGSDSWHPVPAYPWFR